MCVCVVGRDIRSLAVEADEWFLVKVKRWAGARRGRALDTTQTTVDKVGRRLRNIPELTCCPAYSVSVIYVCLLNIAWCKEWSVILLRRHPSLYFELTLFAIYSPYLSCFFGSLKAINCWLTWVTGGRRLDNGNVAAGRDDRGWRQAGPGGRDVARIFILGGLSLKPLLLPPPFLPSLPPPLPSPPLPLEVGPPYCG